MAASALVVPPAVVFVALPSSSVCPSFAGCCRPSPHFFIPIIHWLFLCLLMIDGFYGRRGEAISFFPEPLLKLHSVKRNNTLGRYLSLLVISQFRSCFSWMSIVSIPTVENVTKDWRDFFQRESHQWVLNESHSFMWITKFYVNHIVFHKKIRIPT